MSPEQIQELIRDAQGLSRQAAIMAAKADEMFARAAQASALLDPTLADLSDEEIEQAIEHLFYLYDCRFNLCRDDAAEVETLVSFGDNLPEDKDSSEDEEYRRRVVRLYRDLND